FALEMHKFFGGDALTYDAYGLSQSREWAGGQFFVVAAEQPSVGWGMMYLVGSIYWLVGRNMLAFQYVNAVVGAATAPVIYLCAHHIFRNLRVARAAALFVAFYPSLVLWSSQGLKDGPMVFFLALCMLATLRLGERFHLKWFAVLAGALLGIMSLRFYVFYMVVTAIGGAFVVGMRKMTANTLARQIVVIVGLGLAMTYFGVLRSASAQFETFGNLEAVQRSRADLARSAESGFGKDVDVSTTSGALSAIPLGMVYLLFAPFPWQLANLRQSITLPEMLVWWASFPLLLVGLWFTLKYRMRQALPILIFTSMLTLAYSVFQGNVGTAYRQRAQLLVFYFIFVSVGYELLRERREDRRRTEEAARDRTRQAAAGAAARRKQAREWEVVADRLSDDAGV
ncbi:MAG: glycosyltransferase family 39 protein, partial [Pyrinomonadaceae bacterium]